MGMTEKEAANDKVQKILDGVNIWTSFYRANPHRFCKDYLNLNLKLFQQVLIYMMNICTNFAFIAARGIGKSFLCAVFCVVRCILYPGTKICIAAKVRSQSINILDEKIMKELVPRSQFLQMEIKDVVINQSKAEIIFKNGSYIKVVTAGDSARGNRANLLVCDECRLLDKPTIDLVLKKFLTDVRSPGYLEKPEYSHLLEKNKEMYLTSAWLKTNWTYDMCKTYFVNSLDTNKAYFCCRFPYQMSIKEGLLMREAVEDEMSEATFSDLTFRMESGAEWIGNTDGGLFNYDDVNNMRKIRKAFYAPNTVIPSSCKIVVPEKEKDEIRILTADIALMGSKKRDNDATSIFLNSMKRNKDGRYISDMVYCENIEGMTSQDLALKLRRYFDYFDCDYIGLDCRGMGLPIADLLMDEIYDPENGLTYPAISCVNNAEIAERCKYKTAPKKIWAILASTTFNNEVALALRTGLQQGRIHLLMNEFECEQTLRELYKGYDKFSPGERTALQMPYINTGLCVNELVNLEYESTNNLIRVYERSGARKDRYSSLSYNYYIAQQLERKLKKNQLTDKKVMHFDFRAPRLR